MSWYSKRAPAQEVLIATNVGAGMMGGTKSPLEYFCAGYATGIAAVFECLGLDEGLLDPARLGAERGPKVLSGALTVIRKHEEALMKDAAHEELAGPESDRDVFRKGALEAHRSYQSQTQQVN